MSRFDRLLLEATADNDDDEDQHVDDRASALPQGFGGLGASATQTPFGDSSAGGSAIQTPWDGAAGLSTPWEDTPNFSSLRNCHVQGLPPIGGPPAQGPSSQPSRFNALLMEATQDDGGGEASRRPSTNSNLGTPFIQTPWEGTAGGLDTPMPWEDAHYGAAVNGFGPAGLLPPPLLGGMAAGGLGPLPGLAPIGTGLSDAALRQPPAYADFTRGYDLGEPARLPLGFAPGLDFDPAPKTGFLLDPLPAYGAPSGYSAPDAGRVVVDLVSELGFRPGGMLSGQIGPAGTTVPVAKARRRRGSKEAKQPDRDKDSTWWLPTATYIDLGDLIKVPRTAVTEPAVDATAAVTA